ELCGTVRRLPPGDERDDRSGNGRSDNLDGDFLAAASVSRKLDRHSGIFRFELTEPRVRACGAVVARLRTWSRAPLLCLSHRSGRLTLLCFGRNPALLGFAAGQGDIAFVLR